jgi:hypothetical protein
LTSAKKASSITGSVFALLLLASIRAASQDPTYGTGQWDSDALGNHRVVVRVASAAEAILVRIPWRRTDPAPEKKEILVCTEDGSRITNRLIVSSDRFNGEIIFEARKAGTYCIYFMPFITRGRNYPVVAYLPPSDSADPAWANRIRDFLREPGIQLPRASILEFQSIDAFNSYHPMEVPATPRETEQLVSARQGMKFLIFPEDRSYPIRGNSFLPHRWLSKNPKPVLEGRSERGEFYSFQAGLYAHESDIRIMEIRFSDLLQQEGKGRITRTAFKSFNTEGIQWDGSPFKKTVNVKRGEVQPLWLGVQIPLDAPPGIYHGSVTVIASGDASESMGITLNVESPRRPDSGDDEPWRHSRLRWLDSRLAMDDEIVSPFDPVKVAGDRVDILGRSIRLAASGLPAQITSFFTPEVTGIGPTPVDLLTAPIRFVAEDRQGRSLEWKCSVPVFTRTAAGIAEWESSCAADPLKLQVRGVLEFDGFAAFRMSLSTTEPADVSDLRLELPLVRDAVRYMMGLGLKGGSRPANFSWQWDVKKNQDGAWLGNPHIGLQFSLRAENYSRPLNTNFYQSKPLSMPPSWHNDGKGGISFGESGATVLLRCFSGSRKLEPGRPLHFDFNLLLTPFKPLNTQFQWGNRFFHAFKPVEEVGKAGANIINVHHANDANPYINYPFIHQSQMRSYVEDAHRLGMKVKIYYTIRELSNRAPELFALRSLGTEIFSEGPGGGFSWLQEHLGSNYIAAWFVPQWRDAAIINSGMSRWHNYYIEGLNWLARIMKIDGIYLDDVAFDRTTMKRIRKVLDRERPDPVIDLHSANQYNPRDGFANSANLYLEHFPYINRLWFGEYFDPESPPDFWLVEMSGIPFGLMGEMLQDGGNRWRGALYGMTCRLPFTGGDPTPVWKIWDSFGIQSSEMIGYWSPKCPVRSGRTDILATAFVKKGKTLVSIASWAAEDAQVQLSIDWKALGLDPAASIIEAMESVGFQPAAIFWPGDRIPVPKGKGWLLTISPR